MITDKKKFFSGLLMMVVFIVVLVLMFMPLFDGKNGMEYLDNLYNSISKGSAYYIGDVKKETDTFLNKKISVGLPITNKEQASRAAALFEKGGAEITVSENELQVQGDLGKILENCLLDAEAMYHNKGNVLVEKYGYNEREVLFNWWDALNKMDRALSRQKKFEEAKAAALVVKKAVETSYNFYRIEPQKITDSIFIVVFSLVFYVIYTLWYGFAIMYMFEGLGMKLEH